MIYWYVLFVLTGYEEKVKDKINEYNIEEVEAFIPKKTKHYKIKGQVIKKEEILFKGYVFVKSELSYKEFKIFLSKDIKYQSGFIKLLEHDREGTESLYPQERKFLEQFTNKKNIIEESIGFIEGDKIIVTSGPLAGHENMIRKIDRHKRLAYLDIDMFGRSQTISIALEIISKT